MWGGDPIGSFLVSWDDVSETGRVKRDQHPHRLIGRKRNRCQETERQKKSDRLIMRERRAKGTIEKNEVMRVTDLRHD